VSKSSTAEAEGAPPESEPAEPLMFNIADARWGEMLEYDAGLFNRKGLRLLTPEARILFHLMKSGPMSVTTAIQIAGTSYRGFYDVLERLKRAGLIVSEKNPDDQRSRTLAVDIPVATPTPATSQS
jgi:hypothetical protein